MNELEPGTSVKRAILGEKIRQIQAQGYEHTVNAHLSAKIDDAAGARKSTRLAAQSYAAVKEMQTMLAELPEDAE